MTKEKYHHGTLKQEMIEKGLQLLNKEGYEGFSLRKVAHLCNVSHAAPYKHFKNKEELISAITLQVVDSFRASLLEAVKKPAGNPKTRIIELGKQYVKFMVENPEYLKFLFLSTSDFPVVVREGKFIHSDNSPFTVFEKSAADYLASIEVKPKEWADHTLILWSIVHGLSVLLVNNSIQYEGDYLDMVSRVLESKLTL